MVTPASTVALLPIEAIVLTSVVDHRPVRIGLEGAVRVHRPRVQVVGEHHAVADEHAVFERDALHR